MTFLNIFRRFKAHAPLLILCLPSLDLISFDTFQHDAAPRTDDPRKWIYGIDGNHPRPPAGKTQTAWNDVFFNRELWRLVTDDLCLVVCVYWKLSIFEPKQKRSSQPIGAKCLTTAVERLVTGLSFIQGLVKHLNTSNGGFHGFFLAHRREVQGCLMLPNLLWGNHC